MRKLIALAIIWCGVLLGNQAQAQPALGYLVTGGCGVGAPTNSNGLPTPFTIDANGKLCVNATVSASITGFAPGAAGTPISVTTGGVTGTLPAGAVVIATNVGTTNGAYCALGGSSSTSWQYIAPGGGWFGFTVGAATQLTCITSTGTTTVNMVGGSGLPTGAGGALAATGSNAAASATGSAVPADASYDGLNIGGTLRGQTGVNPTGSVYAGQTDLSSVNGVSLGSPSAYGTSPGTVNVPGVNAFITNTPTVTANAGTNLNTSALATSANQATEISSLATIATNTGAAIPGGTNALGTLLPFIETAASSGVLKASAGNLYTISADAVTATTDLKLLLFNSTTLPADGTVAPYKCLSFKGDGTQASLLLSWAPDALAFTTGLSAAVSSATACTTKTNVTATISGQVQ